MTRILIADDKKEILSSLSRILTEKGYDIATAQSTTECIAVAQQWRPDIALIDIVFGAEKNDGAWVVKAMAGASPATVCLSMSGESDIYRILDCINQGAHDFLEKPISLPRLMTTIQNTERWVALRQQSADHAALIGDSAAMQDLRFRIKKIAKVSETVLIRGETGTGKERVAENLYLYSNRFGRPFLKVNCAAFNAELLEAELFGYQKGSFTGADGDKVGILGRAEGGTLFLDEIGDMPLDLQIKMLRAIQEKKIRPIGASEEVPIDVRFICATHQDLDRLIRENKFREDLYFRISTFVLDVPPLRDRGDDIRGLAQVLLARFCDENQLGPKRFTDRALDELSTDRYPGNVRELMNRIKNIALFSDDQEIDAIGYSESMSVDPDTLASTDQLPLSEAKPVLERALIRRRLQKFGGNIELTATDLGVLPTNLYRKLRELDIRYR